MAILLKKVLAVLTLSVFPVSAFGADCSFDVRSLGPNNLGFFSAGGAVIASARKGRITLRKKAAGNSSFGFFFPAAKEREGGMLLVKIVDFTSNEGEGSPPNKVRLSRSASKRYSFLGRFRLEDVQRLDLGTASASVLEYQLAHLLVDRINLTGDLAKFHANYAVGNTNRSTYSKELEKRINFAFRDVMLNLDSKKRRALQVAISNVAGNDVVKEAIAKTIGNSGLSQPSVSPAKSIRNLEARLYYYNDHLKAGSGLSICFKHKPGNSITRSRVVVVDNDVDGGRRSRELGAFEITWN